MAYINVSTQRTIEVMSSIDTIKQDIYEAERKEQKFIYLAERVPTHNKSDEANIRELYLNIDQIVCYYPTDKEYIHNYGKDVQE